MTPDPLLHCSRPVFSSFKTHTSKLKIGAGLARDSDRREGPDGSDGPDRSERPDTPLPLTLTTGPLSNTAEKYCQTELYLYNLRP